MSFGDISRPTRLPDPDSLALRILPALQLRLPRRRTGSALLLLLLQSAVVDVSEVDGYEDRDGAKGDADFGAKVEAVRSESVKLGILGRGEGRITFQGLNSNSNSTFLGRLLLVVGRLVGRVELRRSLVWGLRYRGGVM